MIKNNIGKVILMPMLFIAGCLITLNTPLALADEPLPENWTTFTNETYDYKIAHPKSWPVNINSAEKVDIGQIPWEPAPGVLSILVYPHKNFFYVDELIKSYPDGCKDGGGAKMIASLHAMKLVCIEPFAGQQTNEYFFMHGDDLFNISFIRGAEELNNIFEKMIETFDFQ